MPQALRRLALATLAALWSSPLASGLMATPITIVANGWHAGLLVPAHAIHPYLPALQQRFPAAQHYEIGWGDVGFYRAKQISVSLALQALFDSQGAVMHVVAVPDVARFTRGSSAVRVCLTPAQLHAMARMVAASFALDGQHQPQSAGPGIYGDSEFYQATGHYSALNTCNRWTASALQTAGVRITPRVSLTAGSVLRAAQQHGEACVGP